MNSCPKCGAGRAQLYTERDYYGAYISCRTCGWQATAPHQEPDERASHRRRPSTYNRKMLARSS